MPVGEAALPVQLIDLEHLVGDVHGLSLYESVVRIALHDRHLALLLQLANLLHDAQLYLFDLTQTHGGEKLHLLNEH